MKNRYPLVSKLGRPARVCNGPSGKDVYELTDRGGEIHANTFYSHRLCWHSLAELLADAGYKEVRCKG